MRRTRAGRGLGLDQQGGVAVLVALAMIPLLGMVGLALDGANAYVERSRLSRALDAAVLAAAKALRDGEDAALQEAFAVAAANGVIQGAGGVSLSLVFGANAEGENTVSMSGSVPVPVFFMRVLGYEQLTVATESEATIPPIDLVLVIDRSGSLATQNAWVPLQNAAIQFVQFFDDDVDQLGLVSFQVRAENEFLLDGAFSAPVEAAIGAMNSAGDTNTGEGLRLAYEQFQLPAVRPGASKVVVFFTDGRPTAFRGELNGSDRVMAVDPSIQHYIRGYFDNPDALPMDQLATPDGCVFQPTCFGWDENAARTQARQTGLSVANQIRNEGIYIFTIALGNPGASDPMLVPDMAYLQQLANVGGSVNLNQPQGQSYFAPSATELAAVFKTLAEDLLVRLSR